MGGGASPTPLGLVDFATLVNESDDAIRIRWEIALTVLLEIVDPGDWSLYHVADCLDQGRLSRSLSSNDGVQPRAKFDIQPVLKATLHVNGCQTGPIWQ